MRRILALLLLPLLLLTACGGDADDSASDGDTPSEVTDLADVKVTGAFGEKPTIDIGGEFVADRTEARTLSEGDGAPLEAGQVIRMDYAIYNGQDGSELSASFGQQPQYLMLDPSAVIQPFIDGLTGVTTGSRVLLAVPPQDDPSAGPTDDPSAAPTPTATQTPSNTMLFVIDVQAAFAGRATGEAVTPPKGLPTVKLGEKGQPGITMPKEDAPEDLLVQPLITGSGPKVEQGQTVTAMYTGVKWADGAAFDTTWQELIPRDFPIGVGQVIPAWDIGLVGQPIGSQVLVVAPPAQGYGADGNPQAGISGTDTLVFVVDILDAR